MLIHAFLSQNPELFKKIYPEDFGISPEEEMLLEFQVPQSEAEALAMFEEFNGPVEDEESVKWRDTPLLT